jgi:hypothetical protein
MGETTAELRDLWDAVLNDSRSVLDQIGLGDLSVIGPIVGTIIAGLVVWFIINNILG